jgi:hypothetical protein
VDENGTVIESPSLAVALSALGECRLADEKIYAPGFPPYFAQEVNAMIRLVL